MTAATEKSQERRIPLSRERVLEAAVELADEQGLEALSMRNLAERLGVKAMSLYNHVANKEAILDGVIDAIVHEIAMSSGGFELAGEPAEWKANLRDRVLSARKVMLRHRWAPTLFETRTRMSPTLIVYFDKLLGILIEGGFSYDLAHHAMHALGSRALGFNQELFVPDSDEDDAEADAMLAKMAEQLPYIVGMMQAISHEGPDTTLGWCDDQTEFEFGLDLLLDGLDRRLAAD